MGPREHTADRGQQSPVGRFEPGCSGLATQYGQLMTEHKHLQILGSIAAGQQHEQLDGAAQCQVGKLR
jgi:hypothetical protein